MSAPSLDPVWQIRRTESGWPDCLADLDSVGESEPDALYGLGSQDLVREIDPDRTVTIVGSRRSGAYGREVAHALGFLAASAGLLVVSGMALGCDSAAHEGALAANGSTLAVLGGPADVPYPRSKEGLYRRILASGGAVLSEQPSGTALVPGFFPARNRIMAALAGWVVIVEGAHRSGTQHTVKQAVKLGREVLAVPGPVNSTLSELPNELIREGAGMIRDAQDLLDAVLGPGQSQVRGVGPELEPQLFDALFAVEGGAGTCDAVALQLGLDGHAAAVALARLELMGYVAGDAVGRYSRTVLAARAAIT
ncbi:MAG: DNA-protecting protein DprA [Actinomycetota bacterium]|nr:DNA-protecting protein DprA [Actinomycetota bacterium]